MTKCHRFVSLAAVMGVWTCASCNTIEVEGGWMRFVTVTVADASTGTPVVDAQLTAVRQDEALPCPFLDETTGDTEEGKQMTSTVRTTDEHGEAVFLWAGGLTWSQSELFPLVSDCNEAEAELRAELARERLYLRIVSDVGTEVVRLSWTEGDSTEGDLFVVTVVTEEIPSCGSLPLFDVLTLE